MNDLNAQNLSRDLTRDLNAKYVAQMHDPTFRGLCILQSITDTRRVSAELGLRWAALQLTDWMDATADAGTPTIEMEVL